MRRTFNSMAAACLLACACLTTQVFAQEFPGVEKIMTPEQLKRSGLHKLSPAELKELNQWLRDYSAGRVQSAKQEERAAVVKEVQSQEEAAKQQQRAEVVKEVREQEKAAKQEERIVSNIVGEFTGWSGKTIFTLKNGQVWQQRSSGQLRHKAMAPQVEITKNMLGYYVMKVVGTSYAVGVKRIN